MIGLRFWAVLAGRVGREHCEQVWDADTDKRDREVRLLAMQTRRMMSWIAQVEQEANLRDSRSSGLRIAQARPKPLSSSLNRGALK